MKVAILSSGTDSIKKMGSHRIVNISWGSSKIDTLNLRDYDGVVIDASSLTQEVLEANRVRLQKVQDCIKPSVIGDILVGPESFIFIVGDPTSRLFNKTVAESMQLSLRMVDGIGESISRADEFETSPYKDYLRAVTEYRYSYYGLGLPSSSYGSGYSVEETPLLYTRAGNHVASVGLVEYWDGSSFEERGLIGLFPTLSTVATSTDLRRILESYFHDDDGFTDAPEWAGEIKVDGEDELTQVIIKTNQKIQDLQEHVKTQELELMELRRDVEILYKVGKPLEESIKKALSAVGIGVVEPGDSSNVEFLIEDEGHKFVVEVKSTQKQHIDKKALRQVVDWRNDAYDETGEDYTALVVASNQLNTAPSQRDEDVLPDDLKKYAVKMNITVINTASLFNSIQAIKSKNTTKEAVLNSLMSLNGMATFQKGLFKEIAKS